MVVSKPCVHAKCPTRQGYIRGQYESVEIIREIEVEPQVRRTRSSIDLTSNASHRPDRESLSREARLRAASSLGSKDDSTAPFAGPSMQEDSEGSTKQFVVEWIMVTRSDPGGNVPRFMVEKGTPGGIVSDAGRFVAWITNKDPEEFPASDDNNFKADAIASEERRSLELGRNSRSQASPGMLANKPSTSEAADLSTGTEKAEPAHSLADSTPSGFYGMLAGALGAAGSAVVSHLPSLPFAGSSKSHESEQDTLYDDSSDISDASSFHSAASGEHDEDTLAAESLKSSAHEDGQSARSVDAASLPPGSGTGGDMLGTAVGSAAAGSSSDTKLGNKAGSTTKGERHERELRKLLEARRKAEERDAQAAARLRERHERDAARREEKYRREMERIERRREHEERKRAERRRRAADRDERAGLAAQLAECIVERDAARDEAKALREQVGALQAQNTLLVAKLGRLGVGTGGEEVLRVAKAGKEVRDGMKTPTGPTAVASTGKS